MAGGMTKILVTGIIIIVVSTLAMAAAGFVERRWNKNLGWAYIVTTIGIVIVFGFIIFLTVPQTGLV